MELPRFKTFLYCIPLKTGCFIIGILELLQGLRSFFLENGEIEMLTSGIMGIILGAVLLYGVFKLDLTALNVYIWLALIYGIILLTFAVLSFVAGSWLVYAILKILVAILNIYFLLVVNSYSMHLEEHSLPR